MKIAILNKYQKSVNRGAETYVNELSKRLSKKHKVDVLSDINYLKIFKNKYDLIIPTNGRFQVVVIRIITWMQNSKMIVSGQSGIGFDDRLNIYTFPNAFVALSSKALHWANRINPFVKSVYIPNGVDLNKFVPSKTKKSGKTILSVGAFTAQKMHNLVIDAVSLIPDANLIIAGGDGEEKQNIVNYGLKLLGPNRFKILETTNEKMPEVYKLADVFTLASRSSESFGIVLVEAMATNLPVVARDDQIRREIVGEAGIFVNCDDREEYSKSLISALNKNWGRKPREQSEKFNWDIITEKYEALIKSI